MTNQKQSLLNTPTAIVLVGLLVAAVLYVNENGFSLPKGKSLSGGNGQVAGEAAQPTTPKPNVDKLATDLFKSYAQDLGLNQQEFNQCLDSGEKAAEISADFEDGSAAGVSGTPTFFVNGQQIVGAQPYSAFKDAIEKELGKDKTKLTMEISEEPFLGKDNAPVTVVEFTDFQCSFCQSAFTSVFPQLKKDYIETGKVKYVVRDFPLPFHANAQKAAEAANCAGDQGKYWQMHDKLFEEQINWEGAKSSG